MFICNCQIPNNVFLYCTESKHLKKTCFAGMFKTREMRFNVNIYRCPWAYLKNYPKELELNTTESQQDFGTFVDAFIRLPFI